MNRLKSNLITAGIVLAVIILVIGGFFLIPFRSSNALQVSFLAYTNDVNGSKLAIFTVTNVSEFKLAFLPCQPQTKNYGSWSAVQYRYATSLINLSPHDQDTFVTSFPTNSEPWRVPVQWSYSPPNPIQGFRGYLEHLCVLNWDRVKRGKWPKYFNRSIGIMGNEYTAFSSETTIEPAK